MGALKRAERTRGAAAGCCVALLGAAGCIGKPDVSLPPVTSTLSATVIAEVPPGDGPADVRTLTWAPPLLYVADGDGLFVLDMTDPAVPRRLRRA